MLATEAGFRAAGADPEYGLKLPRTLEEEGLEDVGADARAPVVRFGTPTADFLTLSLEHLGARFVLAGLLTDEEVQEMLRVLRSPGGTCLPPIMIAACGRAGAARRASRGGSPARRTAGSCGRT